MESGFLVYDGDTNEYESVPSPPRDGTLYSFWDSADEDVRMPTPSESWWPIVTNRFRGLLRSLLQLSLLINALAIAPPLFVMTVYDQVVGVQNKNILPYLVAGLVVVLLIEFALRSLRSSASGWLAARLDFIVSIATFKHLLRVPPSATDRTDTWTQLGLLRQFDGIREVLSGSNLSLLLDTPFVLLGIAVIAILAGSLALVPLIMVLILLCFVWLAAGKAATKDDLGINPEALSQSAMLEALASTVDIRRLGARETWVERVGVLNTAAVEARRAQLHRHGALESVGNFVGTAGAIATLGYGAHLVIDGAITVGALIASMIIMWRIVGPLQGLIGLAPRWRGLRSAVSQIDRLMHILPERRSRTAKYLRPTFKGSLTLDGVSFRYAPDYPAVITGLNAHIEAGSLIAVTGATGTGKSTLLKLLCGLHAPSAGTISLDAMNQRQIDAVTLRKTISYLPHEPSLFGGTVADNIRFSYAGATDQELETISRELGILDEINALQDGFDTPVSSAMPSSLTYGICLARTFIRQCSIVLLDEPGAYLDFPADQRLQRILAARKGQQTIILTTHRPSHVQLADHELRMRSSARTAA